MMAICHLEEDYVILLENIWNILEIIFKVSKRALWRGENIQKANNNIVLIME